MRARPILAVAAALALALAGCQTSTTVANTWRNPQYTQAVPRRVLVAALVPDATIRAQLETELATRISQRGVEAVPLTRFIQPTAQLTQESVVNVAHQNKFEGLLVSRFKGTQERVYFNPPSWGWGYGWGDYWGFYGPPIYEPGWVDVYHEHNMETVLFDTARGDQLVWAANSRTLDTGRPERDIPKFAAVVVKRLDRDLHLPA